MLRILIHLGRLRNQIEYQPTARDLWLQLLQRQLFMDIASKFSLLRAIRILNRSSLINSNSNNYQRRVLKICSTPILAVNMNSLLTIPPEIWMISQTEVYHPQLLKGSTALSTPRIKLNLTSKLVNPIYKKGLIQHIQE